MNASSSKANESTKPAAGSLVSLVGGPDRAAAPAGLAGSTWVKILVLAVLVACVYHVRLRYLGLKWWSDVNWSHGFLIPLFSLYLLYVRRDDLCAAARRTNPLGLGILILGLASMILGTYPIQFDWFIDFSLIITIFGLTLYLGGGKVLWVAWLPILYLVLAIPIPDRIYNGVALPLQMLAARMAGTILRIFGATVSVSGLSLEILGKSGTTYPLMVAEACSGIRSMMAFVALSVAWAYITDRPTWQRVVLVLAGIPILVACNILRVTMTGTMYVFDHPELGQDVMHEFMGMALLVPAVGLLWLLGRLMDSLFVEVEEEDPAPTGGPAPNAADAPPAPAPAKPPAVAPSPKTMGRSLTPFLIASGILVVTAVGWPVLADELRLALRKEPVAWPAEAVVDGNCRLLSLSDRFGPFAKVVASGEVRRDDHGRRVQDGQPDGENIIRKDELETLGINSSLDKSRNPERRSNWYVSRLYRDGRLAAGAGYWRLGVFYYTGGLDRVPHISEVCLEAGGATVQKAEEVTFHLAGMSSPWDSVPVMRTRYVNSHGQPCIEYYTFSLNGVPEPSREKVRLKLMNPFESYSYFAKIQFGPAEPTEDGSQTDRRTEEFLQSALPEILKALPSREDVQRLNSHKQ